MKNLLKLIHSTLWLFLLLLFSLLSFLQNLHQHELVIVVKRSSREKDRRSLDLCLDCLKLYGIALDHARLLLFGLALLLSVQGRLLF